MGHDISPGFYRHFKGGRYVVIGFARHSETLERLVVYRKEGTEGEYWVRPITMFHEKVRHEGQLVPRFVRVEKEGNAPETV